MNSMPSRKKRLAVSREPLADIAVEPKRRVLLPDGSAAAPHGDRSGGAGLDAGNQLRQLDKVAPVQRQVDDLGGSMTVPTVAFSVCRLTALPPPRPSQSPHRGGVAYPVARSAAPAGSPCRRVHLKAGRGRGHTVGSRGQRWAGCTCRPVGDGFALDVGGKGRTVWQHPPRRLPRRPSRAE